MSRLIRLTLVLVLSWPRAGAPGHGPDLTTQLRWRGTQKSGAVYRILLCPPPAAAWNGDWSCMPRLRP